MKPGSWRWLLGAPAVGLVLWFLGCLNPRPEDFPSHRDDDGAVPVLDVGGMPSDPDNDTGEDGAGAGAASGQSPMPSPDSPPANNPATSPPPADAGVPTGDAGVDAQ